jgi:uncharacterized membrane protein YfcA
MMRLRWGVIIVGIALALVAIRLDDRRVAWVALVVLAIALALRFASPRRAAPADNRDEPTDSSRHDTSAST